MQSTQLFTIQRLRVQHNITTQHLLQQHTLLNVLHTHACLISHLKISFPSLCWCLLGLGGGGSFIASLSALFLRQNGNSTEKRQSCLSRQPWWRFVSSRASTLSYTWRDRAGASPPGAPRNDCRVETLEGKKDFDHVRLQERHGGFESDWNCPEEAGLLVWKWHPGYGPAAPVYIPWSWISPGLNPEPL